MPALELLEPRVLLSAHPLGDLPTLDSNPSAYAQIYLDFDGEPAHAWTSYSVPATPAFDQDGDPATFSDSELTAIQSIWAAVAEKYAPLNLNVTTVRPGDFANQHALHVVIGGDGAWKGGGLGGVSWTGCFYGVIANKVYVFPKNLANGNLRYTSDAIAHEAGHAFGSNHQSLYADTTRTNEYNPGTADRAPLMGLPYNGARSLWWTGPSSLGYDQIQDDLAVLSGTNNGFGYRTDNHGGSLASAGTATVIGTGLSGSGIIERTSDADYFRFTTGAGLISFTGSVAQYGAMLDLKLELRNSSDQVIASADTASLGESLSANVAAGTYYVVVTSHGGYGDIGQYTLGGTIVPPPPAAPVVFVNGDAAAAQRSMVNSLAVTFDQAMVLSEGAILLRLQSGGSVPNTVLSVSNPGGDQRTYVVSFSGTAIKGSSLADGLYELVVQADFAHNLGGDALAADSITGFHRLFGDSDGDKDVDSSDSLRFRTALGYSSSDSKYRWYLDFDGDGDTDSMDSLQFRMRLGTGWA